MENTRFKLNGVYSAPVAPDIREKIEKWLPDSEMVEREVNELVYVDFNVSGSQPFDSGKFGQKNSCQAAWMEYGFALGTFEPIQLPEHDAPPQEYRLCFFLHYFSRHEPIQTPDGEVWWEDLPLPAPDELVKAHPYRWPWA